MSMPVVLSTSTKGEWVWTTALAAGRSRSISAWNPTAGDTPPAPDRTWRSMPTWTTWSGNVSSK